MSNGAETKRNSKFASRMAERLAQRAVKERRVDREDLNRKQSEADERRNGLLTARGTRAGDHFAYASHVAERVTSEQASSSRPPLTTIPTQDALPPSLPGWSVDLSPLFPCAWLIG